MGGLTKLILTRLIAGLGRCLILTLDSGVDRLSSERESELAVDSDSDRSELDV